MKGLKDRLTTAESRKESSFVASDDDYLSDDDDFLNDDNDEEFSLDDEDIDLDFRGYFMNTSYYLTIIFTLYSTWWSI